MPTDLAIQCVCGTLRGVARALSPARGNRVVCYCDDCQAFAHFLGNAEEILDAHGGTDLFQTSPARIEFSKGEERLACMRLRRGGLIRWYASCCRTPIGNTLSNGRIAFVGLIHCCSDRLEREAAIGPVRYRIQQRFATGDVHKLDGSNNIPLSLVLQLTRMILSYSLCGDAKRSPFFDPSSHQPTRLPTVLNASELRAIRIGAAR